MDVTLYRLESATHCYYGISYSHKYHIQPLQLDYERYCRGKSGYNKPRYEILRQREYSLMTLGTVKKEQAGSELRKLIAGKQTKVCLN